MLEIKSLCKNSSYSAVSQQHSYASSYLEYKDLDPEKNASYTSTQLLIDLIDQFVNSLGSSTKFVWLWSDHLYQLRYILSTDLRETRQGLHARVKLFLGWTSIEILQQSHRQFNGHVVEYLRLLRHKMIVMSLIRTVIQYINISEYRCANVWIPCRFFFVCLFFFFFQS